MPLAHRRRQARVARRVFFQSVKSVEEGAGHHNTMRLVARHPDLRAPGVAVSAEGGWLNVTDSLRLQVMAAH